MKTPGEIWADIAVLTTIELDYLRGQIDGEIRRRYATYQTDEAKQKGDVEQGRAAVGDSEWLKP